MKTLRFFLAFLGVSLGSLVSLLLVLLLFVVVVVTLLTPPTFPSDQAPVGVTYVWTGPRNQKVINAGLYVASGLYNGPPDGYDTWYDKARIPQAISFWETSCPKCSAWAQGNLQCVMLITAAFGLAHQDLPYVGNAIDFWTKGNYARSPGWETLSPTALPYPGDMIVFSSPFFGGVGHIVIVVDVKLPDTSDPGYVQFVEANGPCALVQMPLWESANGSFTMMIWPQYTVLGFIRHTAALTAS